MKLKNQKDFINAYNDVCNYRKDYYYSEPLDRAILWACRRNPDHKDQNNIFAKIALVNRILSANLSRYLGKRNVEWRLAERFRYEKIDNELSPLKKLRRLNHDNIQTIVTAHEKLVRITRSVTKKTQNSFCSKYLSFHFPKVVPIFDSYSSTVAWNLVGKEVEASGKATRFDQNWNYEYAYHCEAVLLLLDALSRTDIKNPDLRLVDCVLYGER